MQLKKFVLVPGILELYTNVTKIPLFLFGTNLTSLNQDSGKSMFSFKFLVLRNVANTSSVNQSAKYRDVTICGDITKKKIFFEKTLFPLVKIQLLLEEELVPVLSCNYTYYRLFKFPVGDIPTPGETLSLLIGFYMTKKCLLPLRASAFSHENASTVLFGIKGSGKTTFLFDSVTNHGCRVVGEDTIVLNDTGAVYGTTHLSSKLKHTQKALRDLGMNVKRNNAHSLSELIAGTGGRIEGKAKVKHVIFLKRSPSVNTIKEIDLDTAIQYILLLNRATYSYEKIPVMQTLLYSGDSYPNFRKLECDILRKALKDSTHLVIESQSPQKASDLFFNSSFFKNV